LLLLDWLTWLQISERCPYSVLVIVPGCDELSNAVEELSVEPPPGNGPLGHVTACWKASNPAQAAKT
jgi:hypothetical protein